ncbi:tyrosine-type recombinase/integrase [Rhodoferax fermentans]|uniref:Integrase n=1 Tax=Rhodoferax fermentans TaxID=28066 RepID=A0A1T1AW21_RHOFE|nr:integrase arm-type DNA-binding domain-containing protein [Rhodoferax fermentans]MBK1685191.1 integrase [Rhodoferax fermentans]OOV08175.1 integrase [Rhodoferax fermentans]
MPLTKLECDRAACPPGRPMLRLSDEKGMYLEVTQAGGKYWRLKYRHVGKEKRLALGVYPAVSLAQARKARDQARDALAAGEDPGQLKREAKLTKAVNDARTFEAVARQWFDHWKGTKSPRHTDYVLRRLEADVFPALGGRPLASVTAPALLAMAKGIEARGAIDIAKRSLQTCGQIMRYAVAHGLIERNPAADVKPSDALKPHKKENYARLDAKEMPELLRRIEAYQGTPHTRLAMKLLALTFVRTGELIAARWDEFDLEAARWDIPASRMKMKTPHIVPLAPQAVEVLKILQTTSNGRALLFPGERDHQKPMSNNTILKALERMGYKGRMTGHGFRGMASTMLHEQGFGHHLIELQLAHQERDQVSAAYNHALYLADRTAMMTTWANTLDKLRKGADVIPLPQRAA